MLAAFSNITNATSLSTSSTSRSGQDRGFGSTLAATIRKGNTSDLILNNQNLIKTNSWENNFANGLSLPNGSQETLELAQANLPASYKSKLGLGLMALGQGGNSVNSMATGANMMGCHSSAEALKNLVDSLGAERSLLTLNKEALPALGQVLADSGIDDETINQLVAELAAGSMTLDQLQLSLSKLNLSQDYKGLTATSEGLQGLGQFFASLGASTEIVDRITSSFQPGDQISSETLRQLLNSSDDGNLAATINKADVNNLVQSLRSMGVNDRGINTLANLIQQSKGHTSINDFLNYLSGLEKTPTKMISSSEMDLVKTIMENISCDQELVKTPVFNETLTKLQALGDREIDDKFMKLSPAMQALRGGLASNDLANSFGNQMGGRGGQSQERQSQQEQYRQVLHSVNGQDTSLASQVEATENVQSHGGQESLARQISQKMLYSQRRGIHRLKMKLNPENLGGLDIELKMQDGQLVAHLKAENREAYEALAGEIDDLKQALADSGLELDNLTLSYDNELSGERQFADLGMAEIRAAKKAGKNMPTSEIDLEIEKHILRHEGQLDQLV